MGHIVPEIQVNVGFEKQYETKEVTFFDVLYLTINIANKQLIQLDHITYVLASIKISLLNTHI